jgi:hypothetical protein
MVYDRKFIIFVRLDIIRGQVFAEGSRVLLYQWDSDRCRDYIQLKLNEMFLLYSIRTFQNNVIAILR